MIITIIFYYFVINWLQQGHFYDLDREEIHVSSNANDEDSDDDDDSDLTGLVEQISKY